MSEDLHRIATPRPFKKPQNRFPLKSQHNSQAYPLNKFILSSHQFIYLAALQASFIVDYHSPIIYSQRVPRL